MSQQTINVGAAPNDGTGTPLRTAFQYTNANFTELYTALGGGVGLPGATTQVIFNDGGTNLAGDAGLTYNKTTDTLSMGAATISGDLTVDTNTLFVNSTSNAVCVGTLTSQNVSAGRGNLTIGGTSSAILNLSINGADTGYIIHDGTNITFNNRTNGYVEFFANGLAQHRIAPLGVFSWYDGAGGTRMTLNSTGLGVGMSPVTGFNVGATGGNDGDLYFNTLIRNTGTAATSQPRTGILFSGYYVGSSTFANFAGITGGKENSTSGNSAGFLSLCTAANGGSPTARLTVDSVGNVGVGVTPTSKLHVAGGALFASTGSMFVYPAGVSGSWTGSGFAIASEGGSAPIGFLQGGTERMRIDASGNLLVGKTATGVGTVGNEIKAVGEFYSTQSASTDANFTYHVYSTGASAYRFYVGLGGTVYATNTTISAISDARLKENVQDIDVGLGAILALKPRKFDWKAGKGKDIKGDRGFIAQEFEQVFPQLVDEWKDPAPEGEAPYKSVRQDLIPVLVKAIQELTARVEALEA